MADRTIPLTRGLVALVDEADYEAVARFKWSAHKNVLKSGAVYYYATRQVRVRPGRPPLGKQITVWMHRQILGPPKELRVDHVEPSATLDNRRANLRLATRSQNMQNSRKAKGCVSLFKGVTLREDAKRRKPWAASIRVMGRLICLGNFAEECDAALAYNFAADQHFGEFARMNT